MNAQPKPEELRALELVRRMRGIAAQYSKPFADHAVARLRLARNYRELMANCQTENSK